MDRKVVVYMIEMRYKEDNQKKRQEKKRVKKETESKIRKYDAGILASV